jgi:hypothetical protein
VTSVIIRERNLFKEIVDDSNSTLLLSKERESEKREDVKSNLNNPVHHMIAWGSAAHSSHTQFALVLVLLSGASLLPTSLSIPMQKESCRQDQEHNLMLMEDAAQSSVSTNQRELYEGIP